MINKLTSALLTLAVLSALCGPASAGIFSEAESARLKKSSPGTFSAKEQALLNKAQGSAFIRESLGGSYGIELSGTYWKLSDDSFKGQSDLCAAYGGFCTGEKNDQGSIGAGASLFWETGAQARLGFSLGYNALPSGEYKMKLLSSQYSYKNSAYAIPFSFYVKVRQAEKINAFAGVSVDYLKAKVVRQIGVNKKTFTDSKLAPGISIGAEIFPHDSVSVLFGLKYILGGEIAKLKASDGTKLGFKYDYAGLRINLAARYYFGRP